jgi:hypothetical protein
MTDTVRFNVINPPDRVTRCAPLCLTPPTTTLRDLRQLAADFYSSKEEGIDLFFCGGRVHEKSLDMSLEEFSRDDYQHIWIRFPATQ